MKIRTRITLTFTLLVGSIILIEAVLVGYSIYSRFQQNSFEQIATVSELKSEIIKVHLQEKSEFVLNLAASSIFRDLLKESSTSAKYQEKLDSSQERLERTVAANKSKDINGLFLLDEEGIVIASTDKKQTGVSKKDDPVFIFAKSDSFVGNPHISKLTNKSIYNASAPLKDDQTGELLGVIVAGYDFDHLSKILQNRNGLGVSGETFLVDKDRFFLTPSLFLGDQVVFKKTVDTQNVIDCFDAQEVEETIRHPAEEERLKHLGHQAVQHYVDYRNIPIVGTHSYLSETNWCLITEIDKSELLSPIYRIIGFFLGAAVAGILIFILICLWVSDQITKPIEILHQGAEIIEKGNLDHKVGTLAKDEIGELSRSFDAMVEGIKQSRREIDQRVKEQTTKIKENAQDLEDQRKAVLNILEDVEEEKTKVSQERDKIDAILHSIGDGVFVVDKDLKIILMNEVAADLCGGDIKEVIGKVYTEIFKFVYEEKRDKVNDEFVKQAIATGQPKEMSNHTVLVRPDGSAIAVADSAAPLKDKEGKVLGCVVVFRDVTKEREVDRMKTEFISLASHQLRTPLSAMKWFSEMLLNGDAGKLNKEQTEFITNISQSNDRMIILVNSLLNISRIESGRIIIDPKLTDLEKLVREILSEIQSKTNEKKQKVIVKIQDQLPQVKVDPKLIREVYKNLLTNANKYTPEKGEISVAVSIKDGYVLSEVKDNGLGIPKKAQERIFEKFFRADNIIKLETEGSGLGLYLAKSIVESSGGKIWFESKEGEGSTFWFTLPLAGVKAKKGEVSLDS